MEVVLMLPRVGLEYICILEKYTGKEPATEQFGII
jgi:hypothetical protein